MTWCFVVKVNQSTTITLAKFHMFGIAIARYRRFIAGPGGHS